MVILHFNKLIRNKWVWGVFALLVSGAFCFDFLFQGGDRSGSGSKDSKVAGLSLPYNAKTEIAAANVNGLVNRMSGSNRNGTYEENDAMYGAIAAFDEAGIGVSDASLGKAIREGVLPNFNGDPRLYASEVKRVYGMEMPAFEETYRVNMKVFEGINAYLNASAWVSPMEADQIGHDLTDRFTVRVASFSQTKEEADAVSVDEEGLKKWFSENSGKLKVPSRMKLRYVLLSAADTNLASKVAASDEDISARYELDKGELYTDTDTNGVVTVKALADVKDEIAKTIRDERFLQKFFDDNADGSVASRVYDENENAIAEEESGTGVKSASLVDAVAAENGLKVSETDWVAAEGLSGIVPGFAKNAADVFLGAEDVELLISGLDTSSENHNRYAHLVARNSCKVWLVEASGTSPAHDATFEEAKALIASPALKDARQKAFDDKVAEIVKKGAEAVLATTDVSGPVTFSRSDAEAPKIPNAAGVMRAATALNKGGVSDLVSTGLCRGFVVVCENRTDGEFAAIESDSSQKALGVLAAREYALPQMAGSDRFAQFKYMQKRKEWLKANLERLGYKYEEDPSDGTPADSGDAAEGES